jgi:hypothetical protein
MKWGIAVDSMDRKKELKEQYKQMKTEMGVFIVQNKINNKYLLVTTQNLKGMINRVRFQLNNGGHPNSELQQEWKRFGEDKFDIIILETLDYDKDESKIDYSKELYIMEIMLTEKLSDKNMISYCK